MNYQHQQVAIVGYGLEGQAAYRWFKRQGAELTILDANEAADVPKGAKSVLGKDYLKDLGHYDLIIRSPGVMPYNIKTTTPVTTGTSIFLEHCHGTVIGVTGTKGKGTTTALIHHIIKTAGLKSHLGGNIGRPGLDFIDEVGPGDYVALEMSNLQLWDITHSPPVAVLLAIFADHLDWHRGNLKEYIGTKANITKFQTAKDLLVYHAINQHTAKIASDSLARKLPFMTHGDVAHSESVHIKEGTIMVGTQPICQTADVPLLGEHNLENVLAALGACWEAVGDAGQIAKAISSFQGLPHRLELVREVNGVKYYNDSIGTAPETAMAAINTFDGPKIMILGGSDKGVEFEQLARAVFNGNVKHVILVGQTAPKIKRALLAAGYPQLCIVEQTDGMRDVVSRAHDLAEPGDVILLSPACASFGDYQDYKDRGEQFKQAVNKL